MSHPAAYARAGRKIAAGPRLASDEQLALIFKLYGEKNTSHFREDTLADLTDVRDGADVTMRVASALISALIAAPRKPREVPAGERPAAGYYVRSEPGTSEDTDGEPTDVFYVVVENKAKTGTYAKRLTLTTDGAGRKKATWEYAPGVGRNIALEGLERLTIEVAARFGHLHGICFKCCKQLTDPVSVQSGMGPVCRKALG